LEQTFTPFWAPSFVPMGQFSKCALLKKPTQNSTYNSVMKTSLFRIISTAPVLSLCAFALAAEAPTDIGDRRELFVDGQLVEQLSGQAKLQLHHPEPQEIVLTHDEPWEGSLSVFHSVFKDGDLYRMYYRGWQVTSLADRLDVSAVRNLCYAESHDGIHWRKPELGLFEFDGSKANNIVLPSGAFKGVNVKVEATAVFWDENPQAAPEGRYKTLLNGGNITGPKSLLAFQSPDGIHWTPMQDAPVMAGDAYDSQNLAFWDTARGEYRAYWRPQNGEAKGAVRGIRTATSPDFIHWNNAADLEYVDSPPEHLYTNVIKPYHRAPQILLGFPSRYVDRGWSESTRALPEREHRELRARGSQRYGTAVSDTLIMASRDGVAFKRWNEAFLRPGIERPGTWNYGQQMMAWQLVETKSALAGAPNELSLYVLEDNWTGTSNALRRYTLRLDGFVSVSAPVSGGELITKPIRFKGRRLELNFSTSAAGSVRVEIQDANGKPLPGFTLADCPAIFGDAIERSVTWSQGTDVGALAGQPVRLRFVLNDADVYAFQFKE